MNTNGHGWSWTGGRMGLLMMMIVGLAGCRTVPPPATDPVAPPPAPAPESPAALDLQKAAAEVESRYAAAAPEIREYVLWTARTFGRGGFWYNEGTFAAWPADRREERIRYLAAALQEGEYGRALCAALAEAGAFKDARLVPGLLKAAGYHREEGDYDCRPKWMAVAALARQESDDAVPLLIGLVDHGNQNTRKWARAALARKTGQDFKEDKRAWASWWKARGHEPVCEEFLKPWTPPPAAAK